MLITLLVAFLSLILLMIIHEFGHFIIAKKFGVRVEEFGIGYPPRIYGKQFGQTFYSINWIPLGAFVKIFGEEGDVHDAESFTNLAIWKRVLIVLGGVIAFWVAAIIIFTVLFSIGAKVPVGDQEVIGAGDVAVTVMLVQENSPAQVAGIKEGDIIVGVENQTSKIAVNKISDFQDFTKTNNGKPLTITINRHGELVRLSLTPRISPLAGQGATGVGLERLATIIKKVSWYIAPWEGLKFTWEVTVKSLQGIWGVIANMFAGKGVPSGAELAGPVGITIFLANAASYGLGFFLYFIGSISVLVAIFNLFPIPALDGGKIVFLVIEKLRGRPVPAKWEQIITVIFFILLISMSLFITIKFDVPRLIDFVKASF